MTASSVTAGETRAPRIAFWRACATTGLGLVAAVLTLAAAPPPDPLQRALRGHMADPAQMAPRYLVKPPTGQGRDLRAPAGAPAGAGLTVPYWSTTIKSPLDGVTYNVSMVGSSPYASPPVNTNVTYVPIVVRLHYPKNLANGVAVVFDPSRTGNCDTSTPQGRFFNSPLFQPNTFISNGVNVTAGMTGGAQLESAFQRANFWSAVHGTKYGVTLVKSQPAAIVVDYTASFADDSVVGVSSQCVSGKINPLGLMDINEYDALVQTLAAKYATPTQVPVVLAYNVVLVDYPGGLGNCCIIGYHNAIPVTGGTQLYAVGTYVDPGIFNGISDIGAWSHELGELIDDPFVQSIAGVPGGFTNDLTPSWGHLGQVSGCQNNLEDGDPLTGTQYAVTGVGQFVYHYQDLAFVDWFYRTPSRSTGGAGSFKDNLAGGGQPALCS